MAPKLPTPESPGEGRAGQGEPAFGVLLVDKPAGPTSHDVVAWIRWALRERAVGHCGTLDPGATGLLVVCVGPATKLVEQLTGVDKRYLARFVLGRATTTADADGEVIAEAPVPDDLGERAPAALLGLEGALELAPPAYSAVKVDGQRAHALARAGDAPALAPRPMVVERVAVTAQGPDWIEADLQVSKGTYVRSLALELGRRLGLPCHLGALRRLACAELRVDHPLAVTGLGAEQLPPRPGHDDRKPRWRVTLGPASTPAQGGSAPAQDAKPGPGQERPAPAAAALGPRERAQAALRARLLAPWACLPFASTVFGAGEGERPFADARAPFDRLAQGQRLRADAPTRARLGLAAEPGPGPGCELHALVDRAQGRMLVVRVDPELGRIAPIRTIAFPPAWSPRH